MWIHGGVQGVAEDKLARGHEAWRAPYAAQRALRVEQITLVAKFAETHHCRMLGLVRHFGDSEDAGHPCGRCDVCDPEARLASSVGTLPQLPAGLKFAAKRGKSGKTAKAGNTGKFGKAAEAGSAGSPAKPGKRRGRKASRTPAVALPSSGPSAALVETLRAWRLTESKRKHVPAFRILTNRALVAIAEARPHTPEALREVPGLGPKLIKSYTAALVGLCMPARPRP